MTLIIVFVLLLLAQNNQDYPTKTEENWQPAAIPSYIYNLKKNENFIQMDKKYFSLIVIVFDPVYKNLPLS